MSLIIFLVSMCVGGLALLGIYCYNNIDTWEQNHREALDSQTHGSISTI